MSLPSSNQHSAHHNWTPASYLDSHPLVEIGYINEALVIYNALIERDPTHLVLLLLRGKALLALDHDIVASRDFHRVRHLAAAQIKATSNDARAHVYYADALWLLDRCDEAWQAYEQAIALAPDDYLGYLQQGWCAFILAHRYLPIALDRFQHMRDLLPGDARVYHLLNMVYFEMWQWEKALEMIDQAIALDPMKPAYYHARAHILCYIKGRSAESHTMAARATEVAEQQRRMVLAHYLPHALDTGPSGSQG